MTLANVFDNCVVTWPSRSWLHFERLDCGRFLPIHAVDVQISLGELEGTPGPCFIPQSQVGIWRSADGSEPIVHLDSEGDAIYVPAQKPMEFLRLLAIGFDENEFAGFESPPTKKDQEENVNPTFQWWLSDASGTTTSTKPRHRNNLPHHEHCNDACSLFVATSRTTTKKTFPVNTNSQTKRRRHAA
jgi:hypothetical protein